MTKIVAVRHSGTFDENRALDNDRYSRAYIDLAQSLAEKGAILYLVKGDDQYQGGGRFTCGWKVEDEQYVLVQEPFEADIILNTDSRFLPTPDVEVINTPELDELCNDKIITYGLFADFSAKTYIVQNQADAEKALQALDTAKVVLKPVIGYGGHGVIIGTPEEVRQKLGTFPCIIQEFIDSSRGLTGIVEDRVFDLRVILANGEPIISFVRTPKQGKVVTTDRNWVIPIPRSLWPQRVLDCCARIDKEFHRFPKRLYSIDWTQQSDGTWKLLELNSPPGQLNRIECGPDADIYFHTFQKLLLG